MKYEKNYDDYPKIWTAHDSIRLEPLQRTSRADTRKIWGIMPDELEKKFMNIQTNLYKEIDNIHYTDIQRPHITIEFRDHSSVGYYINDREDKRYYPIKPVNNNNNLAYRIFNDINYITEKRQLENILSKICELNYIKKLAGHYINIPQRRSRSRSRSRSKSRNLLNITFKRGRGLKKQKTRRKQQKKHKTRVKPKDKK